MGEKITVLHVDDEPDFADMAATFLEGGDDRLDVLPVTSPDEGLDVLAAHDVDCIVSDYDMPHMNGIEFLEAVREEHPDLPFILFTGKGSEELASEAISAGVSEYLQKETGTDQYTVLANRITNLVDKCRAETRIERYTEAQVESEQYRQQLLEIISDPIRSDDEKIDQLLELGCERFGVENGHLVMIDEVAGHHEVIRAQGSDVVREGVSDLPNTYCYKMLQSHDLLDIHHATEEGWEDEPAYEIFGLECYIGGKLIADDSLFGTLCFVNSEPRGPFTHNEKAFFDLLVQWFSQMLERRRRTKQADTVFEHTQDALFVIDVGDARTFRSVNRAYEDLTGLSTADVRGKTPRELLGDDQGTAVDERFRECIETRAPIEYENRLTLGGQTIDWHTRLVPVIEDDTVVQLVGATREVTERKEYRRELQQERDRFRAVFEESFDAMVLADDDGHYTEANQRATELFGLPKEELLGRSIEDFAPESFDFEAAWREFQRVGNERGTFPLVRPDGTERIVEYAATANVVPGQHLSILRDITERTKREQALERQNDRLEEFSSIVSHDLRNPLNVADGRLKLARENHDSEHLDSIMRAHDRMRTLIDDLLTLARESRPADVRSVDLGELIESCWRNVDTNDATLLIDVDRTIRADKSRLRQLWENLIRNSVEHGCPDVTVTIGELDDGFYLEDDGPGIHEDDREEVFEAGYSTNPAGTGLGLSIVKQIIHSHGWEIRVTETHEGGVRFEITGVEFTDG